jgi:protein TonB
MHTHVATLPYLPAVQWRRIGASAATITVHLLAGLLLLAPLAPPLHQPTVAPDTVFVSMIEPPPKQEITPPLEVPVIKHVQPIHPPQPILPTPPVLDHPEPMLMSIPAVPSIPSGPAELPTSSGKTESASYHGLTRVMYPRDALRAREQGKVILHVMIDAQGLPQTIEIAKSSGSPRLDRAAREAVLHWHFIAAIENGKSITSWVLVPIVFNLSDQ